MHVPGDKAAFDERRNSSRVFQVPPEAIIAARKAQEWYEREKPEWWLWVTGGQPELTPEEYERVKSKRTRKQAVT